MSKSCSLPSTFKAVVCHEYGEPLRVETKTMREVSHGSAIVKVLVSPCGKTTKNYLLGPKNPYFNTQTPFVPGVSGVGRIAAVGPDATTLKVGQLVFLDPFVHSRDNDDITIVKGLFQGAGAEKLLTNDLWRNGNWAEYSKIPLENCYPLDEEALLGKLGYKLEHLGSLNLLLVAYGGFRSIDLQAGETVIISPATGSFSGAAVAVASAMGARVIAVGRNKEILHRYAKNIPRVHPVVLTGVANEDATLLSKFGQVDAFMDFTPSSMASPLHMRACISALRVGGRCVLVGAPNGDVSLNYAQLILKNITIKAQYMYTHEEVRECIKLIERGVLEIGDGAGVQVLGRYTLENWSEAMEQASGFGSSWDRLVVFCPCDE